jgi:O-antigen/teichoic acid export membrane protein
MTKEIFSFSLWIMVISIAQRFILNITPGILGITSGSSEIAIFSAAMTIEGYIWIFATVFGGMFLPKVAKLIYGDNAGKEAIQALMIKVGRIQFLMLSAIVSIFIMVGRDFFLNWLGPNFEKSYIVTILLILPGLITIPQEIASTTLIASNKVRFNAYSRLVVAAISISLSYFLSLKYASTGAGMAIFIGNMIGSVIVMNIIYARVLKIDVWNFFKECQIKMSLPFVMVVVIGIILNLYITEISWINTFIKITVLVVVYILSAYFTAVNSYEKGLILGIIKKKIE